MRTYAAVSSLAEIAVHTENLKTFRVSVDLEPFVNLTTINSAAMVSAVIVDMVER